MDRLPIDITTSILSKLPVESVFRCRSVCKTWCTVIDDPNFSTLHTNSSQTQNNHYPPLILIPLNKADQMMDELFILQDYNNPYRSFHRKCTQMKLPFQDDEFDKFLVGSCNGLFCFCSWGDVWDFERRESMWVCNPATRECVTLPEVTLSDDAFIDDVASGFGFALTMKLFKVVNVFSWEEYGEKRVSEVRVLTLGSNAWRSVGKTLGIRIWGRQVFVDGYVYWIYFTRTTIGIISFDLESEMMEFVTNPDYHFFTFRQMNVSNCLILGVLDGCLCVADHCSFVDWHEIWVMKEKSVWIKQFVIRKDILNWIRVRVILPICFGNNGEVILLCNSDLLVSYNVETRRAVPLLLGNDDLSTENFHAITFAGSFISPRISLQNIA